MQSIPEYGRFLDLNIHGPQKPNCRSWGFLTRCFPAGNSSSSTREHCPRAVYWDIFSWPLKSLEMTEQTDNTACHSNWTQAKQSTRCKQQCFRPLSHFYYLTWFEVHLQLTGRCGRATKPTCAPNNMCSRHSNVEPPHYAPVEAFGCVSVIALKGVHCNKLALRSEKNR